MTPLSTMAVEGCYKNIFLKLPRSDCSGAGTVKIRPPMFSLFRDEHF